METASGLVRPIAAVVVVHSIATKTWIEAAIIAAKKPVEASISAPIFVRTVRTIVESVASILRGQTIAGGTSKLGSIAMRSIPAIDIDVDSDLISQKLGRIPVRSAGVMARVFELKRGDL